MGYKVEVTMKLLSERQSVSTFVIGLYHDMYVGSACFLFVKAQFHCNNNSTACLLLYNVVWIVIYNRRTKTLKFVLVTVQPEKHIAFLSLIFFFWSFCILLV